MQIEVIEYAALTRVPKGRKYISPEILFEETKTHDLL